jgi:hypothetical protein
MLYIGYKLARRNDERGKKKKKLPPSRYYDSNSHDASPK